MSNHEAMNTYWDSVLDGEENLITIKYEELVSDQKITKKSYMIFYKSNLLTARKKRGFFL